MDQTYRIIKKYPNRRLYDTETRRYITLEEIKKIVLSHTPFQVLDVKTGQDVTQSILLQIIHDHENDTAPIFTKEILQNLIRFYGHPLQKQMSQLLDQCCSFLTTQPPIEKGPENFQTYVNQWLQNQGVALETAAEIAKYNMSAWQSAYKATADNKQTSQKNK